MPAGKNEEVKGGGPGEAETGRGFREGARGGWLGLVGVERGGAVRGGGEGVRGGGGGGGARATPPLVPMSDLLAWVMAFNHALVPAGLAVEGGPALL